MVLNRKKLPDCLNVEEFNSPNKITLLSGITDHLFHYNDDLKFIIRKYKQTDYSSHLPNLFIKMIMIIYAAYHTFQN